MYLTPVVYAATLIPERFRFILVSQSDDGCRRGDFAGPYSDPRTRKASFPVGCGLYRFSSLFLF